MPNIGAPEIILLLLVALLLFGAKRPPEIGRSLGSGMRAFKDSVSGKTPSPTQTAPREIAGSPGGGTRAFKASVPGTPPSHTETTTQLPVGTTDTTPTSQREN